MKELLSGKEVLPNKIEDLEELQHMSLAEISKSLLQSAVKSSGIMNGREWDDPKDMAKARIVLSFLHALNTSYQTKLNAFKLRNTEEKIAAMKKKTKYAD